MSTCGTQCACDRPVVSDLSGTLVVRSTTRHAVHAVATAAREAGAEVASDHDAVRIQSPSLEDVVDSIARSLSPTERAEARAAVFPDTARDTEALVAIAMDAVSVGTLAARVAHRDLLRLADTPERFYAVYQPIVHLDGGVYGYDSLLRASAADGTEVPAHRLFGAAAAGDWTNVLDRIGRETAIRDAAGWLGSDRLFINFIPTSVYRPEVCLQTTFAAAEKHGVDVSQLVFEVVETHRTDDIEHLRVVIDHYRDRGASIALDDVGSGYSGLALVADLAPSVVKIDQHLIRTIDRAASEAIVRAIVEVAHGIGALVVAEGIETAEEAARAAALGADLAQGWHFGRPARPPFDARP